MLKSRLEPKTVYTDTDSVIIEGDMPYNLLNFDYNELGAF